MSASVEILRVRGAALLQDGGRRGHMHEGVPPGGALVPELLARANLAVGNRWDAPAIEVFGALTLALRQGCPRLATEGGALAEHGDDRGGGDGTHEIAGPRYVAVAGGFEAPLVMGGRGALPSAGIGAWLRKGDVLRSLTTAHASSARARDASVEARDTTLTAEAIRVVRGPDLERFGDATWPTFLEATFAFTGLGDRMGTRLRGARLEHRDPGHGSARSFPMARGAIQVPSSGELIVLGPDHPTTGGYPVVATVIRADLGRFAMGEGAGRSARFVEVSVELAHAAWREHRARHGMLP